MSIVLFRQMAERKKTVLIIDDDKLVLKTYTKILESGGFEAETALGGLEGLEKISLKMPDLILLDVIMPVKNGFQVLSEIRGDPLLVALPVIMLTSRSDEVTIRKAAKLGIQGFVLKTTPIEEILAKIRSVLGVQTG